MIPGRDSREATYPRALADVGATNTRFALEVTPGELKHHRAWLTAEFPNFVAAASAYLASLSGEPPRVMAVAIACPVVDGGARMTNASWNFTVPEARERLGLDRLLVVNDFVALARALPLLDVAHRRQVGYGSPAPDAAIGVVGPGSGLGVTGLIPASGGWVALGTEGGHASFAPCDDREIDILCFARRRHPHVSFERLLSGPGIVLIHAALRNRAGIDSGQESAAEISRRALEGSDAFCVEAMDCFCAILGTAAGNLALTIGATGGVFIGGGIIPRLGTFFDRSPFRTRFEDKGRFASFLREIPTYVITSGDTTLLGASVIFDEAADR